MADKTRVAELAAKGLAPVDIAAELGVTAGYISQVQSDDDYKKSYAQLVAASRVSNHAQVAKIDGHYNSIEDKLLGLIDENSDIVFASMLDKPSVLFNAVGKLNGAKRRASGEALPDSQLSQTVNVILPSFIVEKSTPKVVHNAANEVVSVDGRTIATMQSGALKEQLEELIRPAPPLLSPIVSSDLLALYDDINNM